MARFVNKVATMQMKYMFGVTLHKVELKVPYDVDVIVLMKRGGKRAESQGKVTIGKGQSIADFKEEKLTAADRVYKDKATKKFQDKYANILVQIKKEGVRKSVGIVKINLIDYIEATEIGAKNIGKRQKLVLDKCPDPQAYIEFTVNSVLLSQGASGSETASIAETMTLDSDPESEFDFNDLDGPSSKLQRRGTRGRDGSKMR